MAHRHWRGHHSVLCWLLPLFFAAKPVDCFNVNVNGFTAQNLFPSPSASSHGGRLSFSSLSSSPQPGATDSTMDVDTLNHRFRKFRTAPHHAPNITKILLLSDLHTDYPQNQEWLYNICNSGPSEDTTMMIIAGDVSHNLEILQWTFRVLKRKFGEVAFTIGNHDLWIDKGQKHKQLATKLDADDDDVGIKCNTSGRGDGCVDSIQKLEKILQLCLDEDVRIGPVGVGLSNDSSSCSLWVIPYLSWHHFSFDTEPPVECWGGIPSARLVVSDYRRTVWPDGLSPLDDTAAQFLDGLNDVILDLDGIANDVERTPVLSFSHFLPRIELIPEKRYLTLPTLHSCIGSRYLEARLRRLGRGDDIDEGSNKNISNNGSSNPSESRHFHAFGHSHLSWDATIDGIRYVHVPLAYPREWEQRRGSLEIGTMKGEHSKNRYPVCVWESPLLSSVQANANDDKSHADDDDCDTTTLSTGFPSQWLGGWWSKYYMVMPRLPHRNRYLAPWSARRFRQMEGGKIEDFVHEEVERRFRLREGKSSSSDSARFNLL